jgi:hypothetical protein
MLQHAENGRKMRLDIVSRGSISFREQFNTKPINRAYK